MNRSGYLYPQLFLLLTAVPERQRGRKQKKGDIQMQCEEWCCMEQRGRKTELSICLTYFFTSFVITPCIKSWRTREGYIVFNCSVRFLEKKYEKKKLAISKFSTKGGSGSSHTMQDISKTTWFWEIVSANIYTGWKSNWTLWHPWSLQSSLALHFQIGEGQEDSWEQHGFMKNS